MEPIEILEQAGEFLADIFTGISSLLFTFWTQQLGLGNQLATDINTFLGAGILATFVLVNLILTIWFERKLGARVQDRIGPNRVGPWGILQTVADLAKLLTKEIIIPDGADLIPFLLAPVLAAVSVITIWAVVPFTPTAIGADLSIGVIYFAAVSSLGLLAILMAGWSSKNKYAVLGAFRAVAMLVSYEVPLFLALMVPVMLTGSMSMQDIVEQQHIAYFFMMPLAGLAFWVALVAEVGRQPFDVLEAESEIVAGYNVEYGGFAFAMFYAAEWAHGFTICALMAVLYFGGWRGPFVEVVPTLGILYFGAKILLIYFFQVWSRFTVPRLRLDHIMNLCWKFLVPVLLVLLVVTIAVDKTAGFLMPNYLAYTQADLPYLQELVGMLPRTFILLAVNMVVGIFAATLIARAGRAERERIETYVTGTDQAPQALAPIESGAD